MDMLKKLLAATVISGALMAVPFSPAAAGVRESLAIVVSAVQSAPATSFTIQELRSAILQDIEGIKATLAIAEEETDAAARNDLHRDALRMVNILVGKTDGCAGAGVADADDWMTGCSDAVPVHAALNQVADEIGALIP